MFRRIEIIQHITQSYEQMIEAIHRAAGEPDIEIRREITQRDWKIGLMGTADTDASDAWVHMPSPRRVAIPRNCRFYFTEAGWRRWGRPAVTACQQFGYDYRVLAIKEKSVDVYYRDEVQVVVRPRKKRRA